MIDYRDLSSEDRKIMEKKIKRELIGDPTIICDICDGYRCANCYDIHFNCLCDCFKKE